MRRCALLLLSSFLVGCAPTVALERIQAPPCPDEPAPPAHLRLVRLPERHPAGLVTDLWALTDYLISLREWGTLCQAAARHGREGGRR
jgi:hypothetical protein